MGLRQMMDFFETGGEYGQAETLGSERVARRLAADGLHRLARIYRMTPDEALSLLTIISGHSPEALDWAWRLQDDITAK